MSEGLGTVDLLGGGGGEKWEPNKKINCPETKILGMGYYFKQRFLCIYGGDNGF